MVLRYIRHAWLCEANYRNRHHLDSCALSSSQQILTLRSSTDTFTDVSPRVSTTLSTRPAISARSAQQNARHVSKGQRSYPTYAGSKVS